MKATMKLSDIIITSAFANSKPNPKKIAECEEYYVKHGELDQLPKVNKKNILIDGYVRYLVAQNHGLKEIEVIQPEFKQRKEYQYKYDPNSRRTALYVAGVHTNGTDTTERWWRVNNAYLEQYGTVKVGNEVLVATRYGKARVTITKILIPMTKEDKPVPRHLKRVICPIDKEQENVKI